MTTIVHLTASRFLGGPERQMLGLAEALPEEYSTVFVSFSEGGCCQEFLGKVGEAGFKTVVLKHDTPRLFAARRELTDVLRQLRADVLLCHGYKANLLGLLAGRKLKVPVVAVSRGWTGECLKVRIYEALDRRVLRWMDKVVCVSAAQAEKVRRAGVREDKIAVIHNAIRPERFANPDPAYRDLLCRMFPEPPELIVGAAGRLSPEKGFDILIDAAAQVLKIRGQRSEVRGRRATGGNAGSLPDTCHLTPDTCAVGFILFGDGPLRDALARQIAARGLEGRFVLAGFRPDLDRYFPHLDLFVQSSFTEGLPNVILEAHAAGVPVVATSVGGTPEVIEEGKTGWLVPPSDASAMTRRIVELITNEAVRGTMVLNGHQQVQQKFSFADQGRDYLRLLNTLMGRRHRGCQSLNDSEKAQATDPTSLRGCAVSILSPPEVRKCSSITDQWQTLVNASDNLYAMYQSPLWWDHLLATSDTAQLWLAITKAGAGQIVAVSPIQVEPFDLVFEFKSRPILAFSIPAVFVLGGLPLLPPNVDVYDRFFESLWTSFPQCKGIYLKCVPKETFCSEYIDSGRLGHNGFMVYRPDGIRRFHSIKLPPTFDEYLSKFNRKKRYNLKRQERLLREHGNGQLELVRIESPDQVDGFVTAAVEVESHAWQYQKIGPRVTDNATTRRRFADLASRGVLRSYLLRSGGVYCAYVVGYQSCGVFHYSEIAFDDRFASFSPGNVLLYLLIADLIQHCQPREVNLGISDSSYKEQFGNWHTEDSGVLLLRTSLVNRLRIGTHRMFKFAMQQVRAHLVKRATAGETSTHEPQSCAVQPKRDTCAPRSRAPMPGQSARERDIAVCRKTRILFLEDDFLGPEGGTEQHLLFLQRELPRDLFDLHFCVLTGIQRITADDFPVRPVILNGVSKGLRGSLWRLRHLAAYIKTNEVDVVHAFCRASELYACLAVKLAGRGKVLAIRRNIGYWHTRRSRWVARLVGLLGAQYAANCEAAREFAAKVEWIGRKRVTVIPNPAPTKRLQEGLANVPPRASLGIADDEQVVGIVATVRPVKDYATFLRAARLVFDDHPRTRFLIIGTDDPGYKAQMVQLAHELGIDHQVSWLGPMPNPLSVIPLFDVAVLSSRSEAMPNSVMEYTAAGVAIVATDVGGTGEILDDGQSGFLVPARAPEVLAERVCRLLVDSALRATMGRNARHKAETRFCQDHILREYTQLYSRLAGK